MRRLKPYRFWIILLAPLLCITVFCSAQGSLMLIRPAGIEVKISAKSTANYSPWLLGPFRQVDPALGTLVAQEKAPTVIIVKTPDSNRMSTEVILSTKNPNQRPVPTATPNTVSQLKQSPTLRGSPTIAPSATATRTVSPTVQTPTATIPTATPSATATRTVSPTVQTPTATIPTAT